MMATTDDLDESDVLCQKHRSKFNLGFRVQTANLTKKELENLYYTMLDANIELKKTVNAQTEQIKILNTKLYRCTTLQKNMVTKEMSNSNFCCKSTKSLLEENKLSIVNLKKENQRLSERIRVLNMRLCSNKQFMVRQSPMQSSLQTVRSTKIISSTPNEKKLSFLNVPLQSFVVQYVQTGTNTSNDDNEEPKEECSSHKCCTEMQGFKEDLENLQEELSKTQQEYVERIAKLEIEMIKLHNDYIKEKNEKKMTDLNLVNQMKDNKELANRLKTAQLKCDELSMQLNSEKRRITELTTQIKAAQISDDVSKAIENHYAEKSEKLEPVVETLDEIKFDDYKKYAAPDPNVDLNDTIKDIATQWENGKQRRKSSDLSKSIKSKTSRRLSSSSKKSTKIPSAIKSTTKQNPNEKPSSPKNIKKKQADQENPSAVDTTSMPENITLKNQDTQSLIPQNSIAIGDDKKIIPNSNSAYDEIVIQYDPALNKLSSNTTISTKKSYGSDFPPKDDILINEPVSENLIKIKEETSLYQNPDNNSYILKLDDGDNKGITNNQDFLPKEEKTTDESYSQYFSDKKIASEINKDDQNLESDNIPQKLNEETNIENPSKIRSETKNSMNSISKIFNSISNMLTGEKPKDDNKSNTNESVQVNDSVSSIKSNVSRKSYTKKTQQEPDELPVIENLNSVNDKDESLTSVTRKKNLASKSNVFNITNNGKEITTDSENELEKGKKITENKRRTSTGSKSSKRSVKINPHASSRTRSGSLISLATKVSDKLSNGEIDKFSGVTNVSIKSKANIQENKSDDTQEESKLLLIGKPTYSVLNKVKNNYYSNKKDTEIVDAPQESSPVLPTKTHATNTPHRIIKKDNGQSIKKAYNTLDFNNNTSKSRLISKRPINTTIVQQQARSAETVSINNNDSKRNTSPQSNVSKKPIDKNNHLAESQFSPRTDQESRSKMGPKIAFNRSVSPRANQDSQSLAKPKISPNRNVSPHKDQESEPFTRPKTPPNRTVPPRAYQDDQSFLVKPKTSPNRNVLAHKDQKSESSTRPKTPPSRSVSSRKERDDQQSLTRSKTPPNRSALSRTDQDNQSVNSKMSPVRNISPRRDQESESSTRPKTPPNRSVSSHSDQENKSLTRSRTPPNRSVTSRSDQESPSITKPKTLTNKSISTRQENQSSIESKMTPSQNVSSRRNKENQPLTRSKTPPNSDVSSRIDQESKYIRPKTPPARNKSPRSDQNGEFLLKPKISPNWNASFRKDQENESLSRSKIPPKRSGSPRKDQETQYLARPTTPPSKSASPGTDQERQFLNPKISPNKNLSPRTDQRSKPLSRPVSTNKNASSRTNQESESVIRPNRNVIVSNNKRPLVQSTPQKFKLLTDNNSSKNVLRKTKPLSERSMIKKVVMRPQPIRRPVANASLNTSSVNENIPMSSVPQNEYRNNDSGFGDDRNQDVEKLNNEDLLNMIFSLQKQLDELKSITTDIKKNSVIPEPEMTPMPQISPKRNVTVPVLKNVKDYDCIVVDPKENVILDIKHVNQEDPNDNLQEIPQPVPLANGRVNLEPQYMTESFYGPTEQNNVASSSYEPPYYKKQFDYNDVLTKQEELKNTKSPNKGQIKSKIISETLPKNSRTATDQGPSKMARERILQDLPKNHSRIKSKHHENVEKTLHEKMSPDDFEKADQKITAAEKESQIIGKLPRYFSGTSLWDQKRPSDFWSPPIKNNLNNNEKVMADEDKPEPKPPPPPIDGNTVPFPVNQEKYLKNAANWMEDKKEQKKGEGGPGGGAGQKTGQSSRGGETSKIHHEEQQEPDLCAHFIKICRCPKTPRKDVELFRTCSGTLRFKAYDPASGGFRRCECSKNDREGAGPGGGQDNGTSAINMNSNRYAVHPSPVSGATENDISSTAMNSRHTRSNLGNRSSSGEYDSTYARSYTPPLSPYDQISEGEVKSAGERAKVLPLTAKPPQSENEKMSQNMESTLQKITEELAKCNRLLMYQKNNLERPTSLTRNASVQVRGVSMTPEGIKRSESVVVSFVPKCVFTIFIGSMILSDEAVLQASTLDLILMWKYYDQNVAMTEFTPGRKIQLHSSSTYDIRLSDEFFDYMRKKEMKIVLCELNNQDRVFGYCYLPLRDSLINVNRRVDMSLALIAGPRLIVNTINPEFEIGVIDLWCHLQVQQKFMPYFNEALSKKSTFAQGAGRATINNSSKTMLPQYNPEKNNRKNSDAVCSEDLEILSESKRTKWIQHDMKKYGRRASDSSSDNRVGSGLKSNNTAMLQEGFKEGKETTEREAGNPYINKTTSTRDVGRSPIHRKIDYNYEDWNSHKSDISSNLGLLHEGPMEKKRVLASEVPTKVKTLREIEAIVEKGDRRDSISTSLKMNEYPLQSRNEQWKYYDQLPERDTIDVEKAPKDKKSVTIEDAKQIRLKAGEVAPEIVEITILWLALNEESAAMNNKTIHSLFIAYSFLGNHGAELETPISLPKPKHQLDKCHFNFQKTFVVATPMEYRIVGHLGKCSQRNQYEHNPKDCITFSVVSEPTEDPLGLANCEDIGHAYLYLGDLLQFSAGGDTYTEVLPVMCAKNPTTVMGVLSVKVDGLNFVRHCTRMLT